MRPASWAVDGYSLRASCGLRRAEEPFTSSAKGTDHIAVGSLYLQDLVAS